MSQLSYGSFAGLRVVSEEPDRVVSWLLDSTLRGNPVGRRVHLLSGHGFIEIAHDAEFEGVLKTADLVIPDGRWLEILTKRDPNPLRQLRGADLLERIIAASSGVGVKHFFIVPRQSVFDSLVKRLEERYPGAQVAGGEVYPFGSLSDEQKSSLSEKIHASGADMVWFGISTPRQDKESVWLSKDSGKTVLCVGAALEFVGGLRKAAPRWVQRLGLEWLFRFFSEPRRLWRRYILGSVTFVSLVWRRNHIE